MPRENQLYEQWRSAPVERRRPLEDQLYSEVRKHAAAIIWQSFADADPQLAGDIATDVIRQLETFRGESQFGTWVHGIAIKKIKQEIRRRVRYRRVVDDTITLEDVDDKRRLVENQELMIPVIDLDRLRQGLTLYETMLFDFRLEGISDKEIAEKLKKNPDAVESALRRVLKKLRKNKNARLQQGQRLDEIIFQCRQPLMNFQE